MLESKKRITFNVILITLILSLLSLLLTPISNPIANPIKYKYTKVSWYGNEFHGRQTANGEIYNENKLVGASRDLPFDTRIKIINLKNDKSVIIRIIDRGPFVDGRGFDLSKAAFDSIANLDKGVIKVKYVRIEDIQHE